MLKHLLPATAILVITACGPASQQAEEAARVATEPTGEQAEGPAEESLVLLSDTYRIEERFDSMHGPAQTAAVRFPDTRPGELVWLRGIENVAIEEASGEQLSDEFLCHSNLNFAGGPEQFARQTAAFAATASLEPRVLTMIQGRNSIRFPPGFGFPVQADEPLEFFSMVINKNHEELPLELKVQTTLRYVRDEEAGAGLIPLFRRRLFTFVQVPKEEAGGHHHGGHGGGGHGGGGMDSAAMEGEAPATGEMASDIVGRDAAGNEYTFHWIVPPGRHEYRSPLGRQLRLPFDTTAHYITAHLHPYGESVEIVDRTTGESVIRLGARPYEDGRIGIAHMDEYSDAAGIPFYADHDYELVTLYNNTSGQPIDAMSIVYLFFRDHGFRPAPAAAG